MECFKHVLPSMKLAIPSAAMVCVNIEAITVMVISGFSAAVRYTSCGQRREVSNELGAGNADRAKNVLSVTLKLSIFLALVVVLSLIFGHNLWASAFSNSPVIKKDFASITPLLVISILFDSAQGVLSGTRGCGWQHLAVWTNLAAFYVIGMPIAILLGFKVHLYTKVGDNDYGSYSSKPYAGLLTSLNS
ncbi:hypothetical protein IFM89_002986 [Coptis chinensis]|uniref:Uncharacterized protein n=1 Tax=Coptis chinensis TaxID=261450 RepID=A0A835LYI8_9MAGN|nr:hypothetical protein IFM89_002986 [Coptis chinensis]